MIDVFGRQIENSITPPFRNYVDDPYLLNSQVARGGMRNMCGMRMADGPLPADQPADTNPTTKVMNMKNRQLIKTGLALVGAFVVASYLYKKFVK